MLLVEVFKIINNIIPPIDNFVLFHENTHNISNLMSQRKQQDMWFRNGDIYFGQIYQNSTKLQHPLTTLKRKSRNGNTKYVCRLCQTYQQHLGFLQVIL